MPIKNYNLGSVTSDIFAETDIQPGVLTHAGLSIHNTLIYPGLLYGLMWIAPIEGSSQFSYHTLDCGIITAHNPLWWQGTFSVEVPSKLCVSMRGHIDGQFDLTWQRLTTTHVHAQGHYEQATR